MSLRTTRITRAEFETAGASYIGIGSAYWTPWKRGRESWTVTSTTYPVRPEPDYLEAYRMKAVDSIKGELESLTAKWVKNGRLDDDPLGSYNGIAVEFKGQGFLLVGPPRVFYVGPHPPSAEEMGE